MDYFQNASTAATSTIDSSSNNNFYPIINNVKKINCNLKKNHLNQLKNNFFQKIIINNAASGGGDGIFTNLFSYKILFQYYFNYSIITLNQQTKFQLKNNKFYKNNLSFLKLKFFKLIWLILFIIIQCTFITKINANDNSNNKLLTCKRYQACSAEIRRFPLLAADTTDENIVSNESNESDENEGSGQSYGSGLNGNKLSTKETHFPLYDEFVSERSPFDYHADPEINLIQICQCPQNESKSNFKMFFFLFCKSS